MISTVAKIVVIQHVPYEPLGTLDPLIRQRRHRIKYLNFARDPEAQVDINRYDALIILGGPMNIGQEESYPHLEKEKLLIRQAHNAQIPILGICLGAQLIAAAMGAKVFLAAEKEVGWRQLSLTSLGKNDPVVNAFANFSDVFQWHECTFELPHSADLLVTGEKIANQGFRVGKYTYGFQFHLEANRPLIERWLNLPAHQSLFASRSGVDSVESIREDTDRLLGDANNLGDKVFGAFLDLVPEVQAQHQFIHRNFNQLEYQL